MNDETLQTEEPTVPEAETSLPSETEAAAPGDGPVAEETVAVVTVEAIQAVGYDIVHANLFGSFLICGTLVGLALWRKIHGT